MAWINFGNGLTQIDLVNNKFRIVGSKSGEYFNVVSSEELEGFVQLNPSSPQSGEINLINGSDEIAIGGGGINYVDGSGLNFTSGLTYYNSGLHVFRDLSNNDILKIQNGNVESLTKLKATSIDITTTPTTDATPANILTWDATTKEVKKVDASSYQKNIKIINPEDYGIIGDGSTDNTLAMNAMFDDIATKGNEVRFPSGNFLVSDSVIVKYRTVISGANGTVITQTSPDKTLFFVDDDLVKFQGLTLDNSSAVVTAGSGIEFNKSDQSQLDGMFIKHFYKNVNIINGSSWFITNSVLFDPVLYNLQIQDLANPDAGDAFISNSFFWAGKYENSTHIYQRSGGGLKLINNKFNKTFPYQPLYALDLYMDGATSIILAQNNSFESFQTTGVRVRVDTGLIFRNVLISNNQFSSYTADAKTFIEVDGSNGTIGNVAIQGNDLFASNSTVPLIKVNTVVNSSIGGNVSNIDNISEILNSTNNGYNISESARIEGKNTNPSVSVKNTGTSGFPLFQLNDARSGGQVYNIENGRGLGRFSIRDNIDERLTILNGKVGIKNTNPQSDLDVIGSIRASTNDETPTAVLRNSDLPFENYLASGTGASTTITIPHGLTGITATSKVIVQPLNAASAGVTFATIGSINIVINYTIAPAAGTNNLNYSVLIKK